MRKLHFFVVYAFLFLLLDVMLSGCDTFLNSNPAPPNTEAETPSTPEDAVKKYKKGTLSKTSYASDYLDLKFIAPKGYTMKTEEELKALSQTSVQGTGQVSDTGSGIESIKEMQVTSPNSYPSLTISIEKGQNVTTVEEFLNTIKTRDASKTNSGGASNETVTTVELAGHSYKQLSFSTNVTTAGRVVLQSSLARECPDGMMLITVLYTEATKEQMNTLMKGFARFSE